MSTLLADLRFAVRALLARPAFSALVVFTLAIGIGVNTVAFSAINAALWKPHGFAGASELGWIMTKAPGNAYGAMALPDFQDLARSNRTFESMAAEARMPLSTRIDGAAQDVWALLVSAEYFTTLRARARIGRLFEGADLDDLPVVVSERFWTERLGGGDSLAGRTLTFNGHSFAIVGVLPDGFQGPGGLYEPSVWLPLERMDLLNLSPALAAREHAWLTVVGRMQAGVTPPQAEADLQGLAAQLAATFPATNSERDVSFVPVTDGHPQARGLMPVAWMGLGVVGIVLLLACFNVTSLLLARAAERQREISIRAALGASRWRILRGLVAEGLLLGALSGAVAILVAVWSADLLAAFSLPAPIPQRLHMPVDLRLAGFAALLAVLAGVLPALIPALQATRARLGEMLKRESSLSERPSRARGMFVVAQLAGSTFFLVVALLFIRSFWNVAAFDPGFDVARTLTVEMSPGAYGYDPERARMLVDGALERVTAIAGVSHAAVADRAPFFVGFPTTTEVAPAGTDCAVAGCRTAFDRAVGRGYFAALGLPLLAGRDFTDQEIRSGEGVIVGAALAAQLWPDGGGVGQWLQDGRGGRQREVIGVAGDVGHPNAGDRSSLTLYRPLEADQFLGRLTLVIRTAGDPRLAVPAVQQQLRAMDENLPVDIRTMPQRMEIPLWPSRTAAGLLAVCGALALVLATVGLFGATYYAVSRRMREFGVRIALGATRGRLLALVLREGLALTLAGIFLGSAAALVAARVVSSALFGISPHDPLAYGAAALLQVILALTACALPAHQATTADPIEALR